MPFVQCLILKVEYPSFADPYFFYFPSQSRTRKEVLLVRFVIRRHAVILVDPAMSLIVEALALTPSDIISVVVQKTCQDRETQFMVNLEGGKQFYRGRKYTTLSCPTAMRSCLTCFLRNEAVNRI